MTMNDRPTRTDTLLTVAFTLAERSTCTRLHVGAVAAYDGRILSTGYNGAPAGTPHCTHPKSEVCQRSVHAEANVVAYAARHGVSLLGADIYATDSPCYTCACLLINAGVSRVVFVRKYRDVGPLTLLTDVGVEVYHIDVDNPEVPPSENRNPYEIRTARYDEGGDADKDPESGV